MNTNSIKLMKKNLFYLQKVKNENNINNEQSKSKKGIGKVDIYNVKSKHQNPFLKKELNVNNINNSYKIFNSIEINIKNINNKNGKKGKNKSKNVKYNTKINSNFNNSSIQLFSQKSKDNDFSDFELNNLTYSEAVKLDKRSFFTYYCQLLRREHLILFTFFSFKDHNIFYVKLSKFFFDISLDFTLNIVFFIDDSMHKIYLDYGKYNFVLLIPQIIYSTIVSEVLDIFLRYLSTTEKDIYTIKRINKKNDKSLLIKQKIFKVIKCIKIKLFFYFLVTYLLICFFWYYISAFCAVYKNTQSFLIKDSLLSLLISLIYPFALYMLPTGLRIISLKDKKKRLKFLFKLSEKIPLI